MASHPLFERLRFGGDPVANPASVVRSGNARFTVLTPRMLRLEWAANGRFDDRATYAFPTRRAAAPPATVHVEGGTLFLDTGALSLRYYQDSGPFTADNLSVSFDLGGQRQNWAPDTSDPLNLRGTRRTLDECAGDAALGEGLLSRAGWSLLDDSRSVRFDSDGWVAPPPDHYVQDWVLFAYGHDYRAALADYVRFGGPVPLVPRFILGAWWSRYWAYSEQELRQVVADFEQHGLPLDVLVVDMDWHTPDAWTGYTWNRDLFPDPPAFMRWIHDKGLRVTLNLHPAQGVQPFEEIYPRFARAMGGAGGQTIPFRISDKKFVQNYFELLHHPMEDDGVDFWWMDWQQGVVSELKGLDPLPWINHLHYGDSRRRGQRPMLYSRWGGLGNHRYPIGFSGDTYVVWTALQFQPYITASAANVGCSWWSHDIGGHQGGATAPELYARWVQFGALSPCLRLHATKDPLAERRPWTFPAEVFQAARDAFTFRYRLLPYLYTMARVAADTGLALCRPMYYEYPEEEGAYVARYQYFLGDQLIAAPIVHPADPATGLAAADVWLPPGSWTDWATRERLTGPRWVRLVGGLERMPLLARSGAIVPLAEPFVPTQPPRLSSGTTEALPRDGLILSVFPGEGCFRLYDDDGVTEAYLEGECEWSEIRTRQEGETTWLVEAAPVEGHCPALPETRRYEIRLEGSSRPDRVTIDGVESGDWSYDSEGLVTVIRAPLRDKRQPLTVTAHAEGGIVGLGAARDRAVVAADVRRLLGERCPPDPLDVDSVLRLDAPGRADAVARLGGPFVRFIEFSTPEEAAQQLGRVIVAAPADGSPFDLNIVFTLRRGGEIERRLIQRAGAVQAQIVDVPFAFDGPAQTTTWHAEVILVWRGQTLAASHHSSPLFPTIPAWRVVVYDREKKPLPLARVMDATGRTDTALSWRTVRQETAGLRSLQQIHAVNLEEDYRKWLEGGEPLASYLAATVFSREERAAVLAFWSAGPVEVYVNGARVEEVAVERETTVRPPFYRPVVRRTTTLRLRAGDNRLVIKSEPSPGKGDGWFPRWVFSAALMTPEGEVMEGLVVGP